MVLAYLECLKQQNNVPTISTNDRRLRLLEDAQEAEEEDRYEEDDIDQVFHGRFVADDKGRVLKRGGAVVEKTWAQLQEEKWFAQI